MSALETAQYLITTYDLPLTIDSYTQAAMAAVDRLYRSVSLKPGVEQMLARLERQGARMCVCSATWQFMCERVLGRLGVLDKFQFVLTAGNDNSKHRPDVFYQALGRLGGSDPAQCVVCEDALYAARTAHDAGFTVIGVADAASAPDEAAIRAVSSQFLTGWDQLDWTKLPNTVQFYQKAHLPRCSRLHSTKECGAPAPCSCIFLAKCPAFWNSQIHP